MKPDFSFVPILFGNFSLILFVVGVYGQIRFSNKLLSHEKNRIGTRIFVVLLLL